MNSALYKYVLLLLLLFVSALLFKNISHLNIMLIEFCSWLLMSAIDSQSTVFRYFTD